MRYVDQESMKSRLSNDMNIGLSESKSCGQRIECPTLRPESNSKIETAEMVRSCGVPLQPFNFSSTCCKTDPKVANLSYSTVC